MRFLKGVLPNITIALSLVVPIVLYVHWRNPFMAFLTGMPFTVLCGALCLFSFATSCVLYASWRKEPRKKKRRPEPETTEEE